MKTKIKKTTTKSTTKKEKIKTIKRKTRNMSKLKALSGGACIKRALDALVHIQSQAQVYKLTLRKAKREKDTKTIEVVEKLLRLLEKDKQVYLKKLAIAK